MHLTTPAGVVAKEELTTDAETSIIKLVTSGGTLIPNFFSASGRWHL